MKKLTLLLLLCASTQIQGMEQVKRIYNKHLTDIKYWFYKGDKLWKDGEHHAKAIDHLNKNSQPNPGCLDENGKLTFECTDFFYHDEQLNDIRFKLYRIYRELFCSRPCFRQSSHLPGISCFDDFKKFKEEVEKNRQP